MELIIPILIVVGVLFLTRAFGAWMLRIDEVVEGNTLNQMLGKERDMLSLKEIIGLVKVVGQKQLKFIIRNMLNIR